LPKPQAMLAQEKSTQFNVWKQLVFPTVSAI